MFKNEQDSSLQPFYVYENSKRIREASLLRLLPFASLFHGRRKSIDRVLPLWRNADKRNILVDFSRDVAAIVDPSTTVSCYRFPWLHGRPKKMEPRSARAGMKIGRESSFPITGPAIDEMVIDSIICSLDRSIVLGFFLLFVFFRLLFLFGFRLFVFLAILFGRFFIACLRCVAVATACASRRNLGWVFVRLGRR